MSDSPPTPTSPGLTIGPRTWEACPVVGFGNYPNAKPETRLHETRLVAVTRHYSLDGRVMQEWASEPEKPTINTPLADLLFTETGCSQELAIELVGKIGAMETDHEAADEFAEIRALFGYPEGMSVAAHVKQVVEDHAELRSQLAGVQGALADAGDVLAIREDGNYGESVRELMRQRDAARAGQAVAADDGEAVTEEWLVAVLPNPDTKGRFAEISWAHTWTFCVWLNGRCFWSAANADYYKITRGDVRRLTAALGITLTEPAATPTT